LAIELFKSSIDAIADKKTFRGWYNDCVQQRQTLLIKKFYTVLLEPETTASHLDRAELSCGFDRLA
jgi:hypothetical protein